MRRATQKRGPSPVRGWACGRDRQRVRADGGRLRSTCSGNCGVSDGDRQIGIGSEVDPLGACCRLTDSRADTGFQRPARSRSSSGPDFRSRPAQVISLWHVAHHRCDDAAATRRGGRCVVVCGGRVGPCAAPRRAAPLQRCPIQFGSPYTPTTGAPMVRE